MQKNRTYVKVSSPECWSLIESAEKLRNFGNSSKRENFSFTMESKRKFKSGKAYYHSVQNLYLLVLCIKSTVQTYKIITVPVVHVCTFFFEDYNIFLERKFERPNDPESVAGRSVSPDNLTGSTLRFLRWRIITRKLPLGCVLVKDSEIRPCVIEM